MYHRYTAQHLLSHVFVDSMEAGDKAKDAGVAIAAAGVSINIVGYIKSSGSKSFSLIPLKLSLWADH